MTAILGDLGRIRDAIRYGLPMPTVAPPIQSGSPPRSAKLSARKKAVSAPETDTLEPFGVRPAPARRVPARSGALRDSVPSGGRRRTPVPASAEAATRNGSGAAAAAQIRRIGPGAAPPAIAGSNGRQRSRGPGVSLAARFLRVFVGILVTMMVLALAIVGGLFYLSWFATTPEVPVPDLWGKTEADARTRVGQLQLQLAVDPQVTYDPSVDPGQVIRQVPPAGFHTKAGRTITIFLSAGSRTVTAPSVMGKTLDEALAVMEKAGLRCKNNGEMSSATIPYGSVAKQWPRPGGVVARGIEGFVRVSGGPSETDLMDGNPTGAQSRTVALQVPADSGPSHTHTLDIREIDLLGSAHTLWQGNVTGGQIVERDVMVDPFNEVQVYLDGHLVKTKSDDNPDAGVPGAGMAGAGVTGDSGAGEGAALGTAGAASAVHHWRHSSHSYRRKPHIKSLHAPGGAAPAMPATLHRFHNSRPSHRNVAPRHSDGSATTATGSAGG